MPKENIPPTEFIKGEETDPEKKPLPKESETKKEIPLPEVGPIDPADTDPAKP